MNFPFKSALFHAYERLIDESLGETVVEQTKLIFFADAACKLAQTEEILTYLKSGVMFQPGRDLIVCGGKGQDLIVLPNSLYGFSVYVSDKMPTQTAGADKATGVFVRRCVPKAYLWWELNKMAWTSTVEYQF